MEWCAATQVMIARRRFAPNKSKSHVQTISENVYPSIYYLSSHVKAEMKVQCVQAKGKANQKFFWHFGLLRGMFHLENGLAGEFR